MFDIRRDRVLIGVLATIIVGAVVSRWAAGAGFWLAFAGLAALFLSGLERTVPAVARYRRLDALSRAWVALQGIELILILNAVISHTMSYFFVLVILGAEYFIWDKESRR